MRLYRLVIDAAQLASSSLYAYLLHKNARRLTSDHTWMQVTFGTAMCLSFNSLRLRTEPHMTAEIAERTIWRSFIAGGIPIIIWQLWHADQNHRAADAINYAPRQEVVSHDTAGTPAP